ALSAIFLQPPHVKRDWVGRCINVVLGWFFRLFNRAFDASKNAYVGTLRRCIRVSLVVMLVYGGLLFLTGYAFKKVPTGFIPDVDQGLLFINIELPEGASIERTALVVDQVEAVLQATPGIANTIPRVGNSNVTQATASNM